MPQIRIERTPIKNYGIGVLGADHLLLTFVPDEYASDLAQDNWFVIEGLKAAAPGGHLLGVDGTDGQTTLSEANEGLTGSALVAAIGTPAVRNSTVVNFPQGAFEAWQTMAGYAHDIDEQFLPYQFYAPPYGPIPTSNSSSVVASLLFYAGIDVSQVMPLGWRHFTAGATTLLGTSGNDEMFVDANFKHLLGGDGSDILHGSDGNDRLNGGRDADLFHWSAGFDHIHGGQFNLDYTRDGEDVVSYSGAGEVRIEYNPAWIPHKLPEYVTIYEGGKDFLYSIERLQWNDFSDSIILGKDVEVIVDDMLFDLKGDSGGNGDKVGFLDATQGLILNASDADTMVAHAAGATNGKGLYIKSAEWIVGSAHDDRIYANRSLRIIDGGGGNDFIDARLDTPFAGESPRGYDIELIGGDGNDTLLSGEGRTLAEGGLGADRFIFTTVNLGNGEPEFVIADAESDDRLFVAYNFFNGSGNGFEGSELLPLLGTLFPFELLQDPDGPGALEFQWQLMSDILEGDSQVPGLIDFIGRIAYRLDGDDLLIELYQGTTEVVNNAAPELPPDYFTIILTDPDQKATIRIIDFEPGDLGIVFHDPGTPQSHPNGDFYPNWDDAVSALLNDGQLDAPIAPRPAAPVYDPSRNEADGSEIEVSGTEGDDVIVLAERGNVNAGAGDDHVTGSAFSDRIDGGSGGDVMAGGGGDDVYIVDSAHDLIVELASEGVDTVLAHIDFTLPAEVENIELAGTAVTAIGNGAANRLVGNDLDNILYGEGGRDTLYGGLGNDTLVGGADSDIYVYLAGEGDDIIVEGESPGDIDTLTFGFGIAPQTLQIYRLQAAPGDLVIALDQGGRVTVRDFAGPNGRGIERITFEDGTVWDRSEIEARGAAAPLLGNAPPQAINDELLIVSGPHGVLPASALLGNDYQPGGGTLSIVTVSSAVGGLVSLLLDGNIRIETAEGYDGLVTFQYTLAGTGGATDTALATVGIVPNTDPVAHGQVPDHVAPEGTPLDLVLPGELFSDADGDPLAISAMLANGSHLPAWLTFDAVSGRFTGTPPAQFTGALEIRVEATDGWSTATHVFTLTIQPASQPPAGETFVGTGADETLTGTAGDDVFTLIGNGGYDTIDGGAGFDTIRGSVYNDIIRIADGQASIANIELIDGGEGNDRILGGNGNDLIDLSGVTLVSIELIDGGLGDDIIIGSTGDDTIAGNVGNDTILAGDGNDTINVVGDGGYDTIDGGAGFDTIRGSVYNDIIRIADGQASIANIELIDGGEGHDRILGGNGNDTIDLSGTTLVSIELIDGGLGDDTIISGLSDDVLAGGGGHDTFVFRPDTGHDVVVDFKTHALQPAAADTLDLSAFTFQDFATVLAATSADGADTLITLDDATSVRLVGVALGSLGAADFVL